MVYFLFEFEHENKKLNTVINNGVWNGKLKRTFFKQTSQAFLCVFFSCRIFISDMPHEKVVRSRRALTHKEWSESK